MKVCTCFLLFGIFAYTYSSSYHSLRGEKKDINLDVDLKGDLEFEVDKNSLAILNKTLIDSNKILRRTELRDSRVETFTDFVQETIKILYTYDDSTFEDFFRILEKEIRKHDNTFKFHELLEDNEIRNLIKEKFDFNKDKSIREGAGIIIKQSNAKKVKELLNFINTLYKKDDREKFRKILAHLKAVSESNNDKPKNDLAKIISKVIRAIVVNHYIDLNAKEKKALKKGIIKFLKALTGIPKAKSMDNFTTSKTTVGELKTNISKNKVKKPEVPKKRNPNKSSNVQNNEENKIRHSQKLNDGNSKNATKVQNEEENKRRYQKKINVDLSEIEETIGETSKEERSEEESDSQQLVLTLASTEGEYYHDASSTEDNYTQSYTDQSSDYDQETSLEVSEGQHRKLNAQKYDTLYIEDFYTTTVQPNVFKREMGRNYEVEKWIESSADRPTNTQASTKRHRHRTIATQHPARTTKRAFRRARPLQTTSRFFSVDGNDISSAKDLRRSKALPLPNEEYSLEAFERKRRLEILAHNYSFISNNSIEHGLKDYVKRRRHLYKTVNELKKLYELNERSKVNVTAAGDKVKNVNESETPNPKTTKDETYNDTNKAIEGNINESRVVNETQSNNLFVMRAKSEENETKVTETKNDINKTDPFNKHEKDFEIKTENVKSNDIKAIKSKKKAKKSKKKKTTNTLTTATRYSIEEIKTSARYTSLESGRMPVILALPLAKEKNNITESTSEATKEVGNVTMNVKKEIIVQKNVTAAAVSDIKVTTGKLNFNVIVPSTRRYRRVLNYYAPPNYY